jgi:hypothetical protein
LCDSTYKVSTIVKFIEKVGWWLPETGVLWFKYEMFPHRLLVLNAWSPAGGATLGGHGNFRRWGLAEGSRSLEVCL